MEIVAALCSVESCGKPIKTKKSGLCEAHYFRLRRTGSLVIERELPVKTCPTCHETKPRAEYYVSNAGTPKEKIFSRCIVCTRRQSREFREANPDYMASWWKKNWHRRTGYYLIRNYALTVEQYEAMLEKQGNLCAICKRVLDSPAVDHDHSTGAVREVLCKPCNAAIGLFREDVVALASAIDYLTRHSQ